MVSNVLQIFTYIDILWGQRWVHWYPTAPHPHPSQCGPGLKMWKGGVYAVKIMIHYQYKFLGCDTHFVQFKEEKLIQLDIFSSGEKQKFRQYHKDFGRRRVT